MDYKIVEKETFEIIEKVEAHSIENEANAKNIPDFGRDRIMTVL